MIHNLFFSTLFNFGNANKVADNNLKQTKEYSYITSTQKSYTRNCAITSFQISVPVPIPITSTQDLHKGVVAHLDHTCNIVYLLQFVICHNIFHFVDYGIYIM
jgi:hypothetical protein